jgi:5-methyltetrahydropteroyltriglutamate--homocysteine methyltransferase
VIQFDEPAFNVYFDEVRDWGVRTLERAAQGLKCTTAVHICYGYGIKANIDWKKTLGSEWRQYEQTFRCSRESAIGQVSLECASSHVPIELISLLEGKDVLVGAIDVATKRSRRRKRGRRHHPGARARADRAALPCTNCGMVPLSRAGRPGQAAGLAAGAALVRAAVTAELRLATGTPGLRDGRGFQFALRLSGRRRTCRHPEKNTCHGPQKPLALAERRVYPPELF